QWTQAFLSTYRDSIVLHIGCGLDTRVYRVDPGLRVRWFDVDLPEVIALRDQLYPDRPGYRRIATSLTDPRWLDELPAPRPVRVVAEGVLMYLQEQEGTALLRRITDRFPSGQIAFDAYSAAMTRLVSRLATVRGAKVELVWGLDDPRDLERQVPKVHLVEAV